MIGRATLLRRFALILIGLGAISVSSALYIPAKAALAQVLLERAWAKARAGESSARPWAWADIEPIAEIDVPRLRQRVIVLEGASGAAMAFGPGHMENTAAIGAPGTAVVAAHRDTQFSFLGELKQGDVIAAVTADGRRNSFRVAETRIVPADASGIDPEDGGPSGSRLVLVTCYPFSGVLHSPLRYVVLADRDDRG